MFRSLLVINSSSHETAVPTDEKEKEEEEEEEVEEEEEGRGENKVKKQKKGYFDDKSAGSQWSGSRSQWHTSRHSPPVLACSSTCPIQAEGSPFLSKALLAAESPRGRRPVQHSVSRGLTTFAVREICRQTPRD